MRRYWLVLVLMVIDFLGALYLSSFLVSQFLWEFVALLAGLVLASIVLLAIATRLVWAGALASIFFAVMLGNVALVYSKLPCSHDVFALLVFVNTIGLIGSFLHVGARGREGIDLLAAPPEIVELARSEFNKGKKEPAKRKKSKKRSARRKRAKKKR